AGDQQRSEEVIRESLRRASEQLRRRGSHDDEIGMLGEIDVGEGAPRFPQAGDHLAAGEGLERERPHEFRGRLRHHHVHRRAVFGQTPGEDAALVTGDTARHAEYDVAAGEAHQLSDRRRRTILNFRCPCTSSCKARVVSFSSNSTERSRGNSFTNRANFAATSTPKYLFWVWFATSIGVMIRIAAPYSAPLCSRASESPVKNSFTSAWYCDGRAGTSFPSRAMLATARTARSS